MLLTSTEGTWHTGELETLQTQSLALLETAHHPTGLIMALRTKVVLGHLPPPWHGVGCTLDPYTQQVWTTVTQAHSVGGLTGGRPFHPEELPLSSPSGLDLLS